jgi:hypothetical protein
MYLKNSGLLASLIFVLWSLGVVLMPVLSGVNRNILSSSAAGSILQVLSLAYVALHLIIFWVAASGLYAWFTRSNRRGAHPNLLLLLYGYTIVMVCISAYFLYISLTPVSLA